MLNLKGKIALVTGCGSMGPGWGNGKAIAVLLARQGASVFGVDLDLEAARVTEQLIREEGGTVEVMAANVKQSDEVQRMVQACVQRFGRIDILINNVGRSEPGGPAACGPHRQPLARRMDRGHRCGAGPGRFARSPPRGGRTDAVHCRGARLDRQPAGLP